MTTHQTSTFLNHGPTSEVQSLAILHLRRDQLLPVKLTGQDDDDQGYFEGPVVNTRFGSFPHTTLVGIAWGSQVRASVVDTGTRGRKGFKGNKSLNKKRKRDEENAPVPDADDHAQENIPLERRAPITASSGFVHLLPPTPESWTASLPHRTQVVYTPDYSYILHRLRARPGSALIEAGAGSGSFTHAAARAVFNGYPDAGTSQEKQGMKTRHRHGKVYSFEFHEQRVEKLKVEIRDHALEGIVQIAHRDVYRDGFLGGNGPDQQNRSPRADAIFLDLPAPWLALRHLVRVRESATDTDEAPKQNAASNSPSSILTSSGGNERSATNDVPKSGEFCSPLNADAPVHVCAFSPCIEQAQRTVSTLRELGWVDIEMVTVAQKRLEIRRERFGFQERGVQDSPATVEEAVERLKRIDERFKASRLESINGAGEAGSSVQSPGPERQEPPEGSEPPASRKIYKEGRIVHRAEPELKSHTSYLVFAVLPRQWTAADEERAAKRWLGSPLAKPTRPTASSNVVKHKGESSIAPAKTGDAPDVEMVEPGGA